MLNKNDPKSVEDFIYSPDTAALIFDGEAAAAVLLKNAPDILTSKPLADGFVIVYVNVNDVDRVINEYIYLDKNVAPLVLGLLGEAELDASGISQVQRQPFLNLRGNGVLLGFIDTGIDYTQKAFRYEDGSSKIKYIWDQTIKNNPPDGYLFGSEYTEEDINRALKSNRPYDVVPHRDTVGHGTFLASVAGSREQGNYMGAAPDAEIIAVKLKKASPYELNRFLIPKDQDNAFSASDFSLGIEYIVEKAHELNRPVAICVSLGTNLGGHDGFNRLEEYLASISSNKGIAISVAAGNEGNAGHHTHGRIAATGNSQNVEVRASDKHEDIYLSLWNYASDKMSVSIQSPTGEQISRVPARSGTSYNNSLILERATVIIEYLFPTERSGAQLTRIKILSATPGIWTITIYGDSILDGTYHMWLPLTGFISPDTVFLSPTPNYTITLPATQLGYVTCGAYNSLTGGLYASSSWGPSRLPILLPDLVAPGVDVDGIFPTGYGKMSGTSVAAAFTTGASALLLQWGIVEKNDVTMNSFRIRANLIAGCDRNINIDFPNNQWGYGKLNLFNTFHSLRPF